MPTGSKVSKPVVRPQAVRAPRDCVKLVARYLDRSGHVRSGPLEDPSPRGKLLHFEGVGSEDVYNICAPFTCGGRRLLAGRIEKRDTEYARIGLFEPVEASHDERDPTHWRLVSTPEEFAGLQDPCVTTIDGETVLGGVRVPVLNREGRTSWAMDFYRGTRVDGFRHFLRGPMSMKDIRLVQLPDGRVCVLSRPQGEKGGRGRIGFAVASSLREVTPELIESAPLLPRQCPENQWVGGNEAHVLGGTRLGVLGHIARLDDSMGKHYYPMAFTLDVATGASGQVSILATRADFPPAPSKRPDLVDLIFSGGLVRHGDGMATLYGGLSDAAAGCIEIPDPWGDAGVSSEPTRSVGGSVSTYRVSE